MPASVMIPKKSSAKSNFFRNRSGSNIDVKKPVAEKQTSATDTFEYFIEPKNVIQCVAAINPTAVILKMPVSGILCIFFVNPNKIHIVRVVINNLYQTIIPSLSDIRRPRIPVKPAKKTAM